MSGGNKITFYSFRNEEPRPYPRRNPKGKPMRQMSQSQRAIISASQPVSCFDISRDSQLSAIASGRSIQIWQINVPQMTQTFEEHTGAVTCVSFSPNVEFFASGAEDKTVIVWNLVFSLVVTTFKVQSIVKSDLFASFPCVHGIHLDAHILSAKQLLHSEFLMIRLGCCCCCYYYQYAALFNMCIIFIHQFCLFRRIKKPKGS